jgi:hypothetical protein
VAFVLFPLPFQSISDIIIAEPANHCLQNNIEKEVNKRYTFANS